MTNTISIIGGSGFIGTRLVARLLAGSHEVRIIDKAISQTYPQLCIDADIRQPEALEAALAGSDIVINLAAEHRDDVSPKSLYDEVNVGGASNVCQACTKLGIRTIVFTSSVAVYGFAPLGTDESGAINPFNDYGRTKWLAEEVYRHWLADNPANSLVIVRPTVVFGERNRGNVYNLLRQIASKHFLMIGRGTNVKSMAYVENVVAFIEYCLDLGAGEHLFNYIDKPDYDMNSLVDKVYESLGKPKPPGRLPYWIGYLGGLCFDALAKLLGRNFAISAIRIKKFCANTMFAAPAVAATDFQAPVTLSEGLERTIRFEFIDKIDDYVFFTE